MQSEKTDIRGWTAAAVISGLLLWGLHFLPFLFPGSRLWGFNHLLFLPPAYTWIYLAGGLIFFGLYLPPVSARFESAFNLVSEGFYGKNHRLKLSLFSAAALGLFWLFRVPTNLLGDGYTLIYNMGNDLPVVFKWSEIGSVKAIYLLSHILPFSGMDLGRYSYAIASVVSGAITVFFLGLLTYELVRENVARLFIFGLLLMSGWMLLFFGYVENYTVIWPFVTAYLYYSIRFIKRRGNLIAPTVLMLIGIILHLQVLFFLVSYPVLVFSRGPGRQFFLDHKKMVWSLISVLTAAAGVVFLLRYRNSLVFRSFFVPLFARPGVPYYSLLSPSHLLDMFNELILLIPSLPVLIILGWKYRGKIITDRIDAFLAAFSLGGLIFIFAIDPKLGMGCDWDLFALAGVGPLLLLARRCVMPSLRINRFCLQTAALTLILTFPFFATSFGHRSSIDHFTWLLDLDVPRSRFGMTFFHQYYVDIGRQVQADSIHQEIIGRFPALAVGREITGLTESGRFDEALALADSLYWMDPYSVEPYNLRGWIYLQMGRYDKAVENLEQSLRLGRYDLRILCNLGNAYFRLNRYDRALDLFRRARRFSPDYFPVLDGLAHNFFMTRQYDSALYYANRAIARDSAYFPGYEVAGMASYVLHDYAGAEKYLSRYVRITPDSTRRTRAENLLAALRNGR